MVERDAPRYVPSGWPPEVNPPGIPDWETTAAAWLLDLVPEYRQHAAVRRHPVILAFIARHVTAGAVEGARQGYRASCTELGDLVSPHAIDAPLRAWRAEGERLAATACAVDLVERALRGETFRPGSYAAAQSPVIVQNSSETSSVIRFGAAECSVRSCRRSHLRTRLSGPPAVAVDHDLRDGVVRNLVARHRCRLSGLWPPSACTKENGSALGLVQLRRRSWRTVSRPPPRDEGRTRPALKPPCDMESRVV
jgi:hypothetical protein